MSIPLAPQSMVGTLDTPFGGGNGAESLFVHAWVPRLEMKTAEDLDINLDGEPLKGYKLRFPVPPSVLCVHLPAGSPLLRESPRKDRGRGRLIRCPEWRLCLIGFFRDTI